MFFQRDEKICANDTITNGFRAGKIPAKEHFNPEGGCSLTRQPADMPPAAG